MNETFYQKSMIFKALSDPNRLVIIDFLNEGERCACKILEQLKISQPTLSHHMRILCEADLVHCRKDGKWIHYSLNREVFKAMKDYMDDFTVMKGDDKSGDCC
ncbi:MAG TPA: metalloregulator ArsR/SmtB family transcription factor [Mobilitalea sp.]|nr:metalloregulator ArsR/SmtB family transcription factor [Mobilitalea sp.]